MRVAKRVPAVLAVVALGALAPAALAVHWPFFGGDAGRSGYQPVDEGTTPVGLVYEKTQLSEHNVKSSILTTAGTPSTQRMVYGTQDGHVHLQLLDSGAPVGPEAGTSIDEGAVDTDVFGTPGLARSVSFADTSGAGGLGQVFAVHNDDDTATGAPDIEVAQLDESDGSVVQQVDVAGTNLASIRSSVVATAPDAAGDRALFFVAIDGTNQRLFRVPITNGSARDATIGTATFTADINTTSNASPTIVYLDVGGTPTAHVAVGTATQVRTFRASDLTSGPQSVALAGAAQTPSVAVQPSGNTPGPGDPVQTAPFIYAAASVGGADTTVYKLRPDAGALTVVAQSETLPGVPAPALATDQEAEPDLQEGKVVVTTENNVYLLSTADLDRAGALDPDDTLTFGTTGFSQTTAAASGDFAYVADDRGDQFVLRLSDGKAVHADDFQASANAGPAPFGAVGQPSISRGFVQFAGPGGVFVYRNADTTPPSVTLTAPSDGATVSGSVTFAATAFDARGIAEVAFRANGSVLASVATPDSGAPFGSPGASYSVLVDTTKLADGQYVVDAVATDNGAVSTTSAPHRVTVRNGSADDRPPSVQFTAPAAGALVRDRTTLSATATDDRGVESVAFIDDDRVICTDTTAPYACSYTPRGDDVGRDTLFAVATDTGDQIAAAIRTVRVDRLLPASVSARTSPGRDRARPFVFNTRGRVNLPAGVTRAQGCQAGVVSVQIKVVRRTVSNRRARLRRDCTFASRVSLARRAGLGRGRLTVSARFLGNDVLRSRSARRRTVRAG